MKLAACAIAVLSLVSSFAQAGEVVYEREPGKPGQPTTLKSGSFHTGLGACPVQVEEDENVPEKAIRVRVTIDEQDAEHYVKVIHHVPGKSVGEGLSHAVVWKNTGAVSNLAVSYPVLKDRSQEMERNNYQACSFGEAYLSATEGSAGKYNVTIRLSDRTVAGVKPVSDSKTGTFAELPVYAEETLSKTLPLAIGDKGIVSWHAPETGLVRHATIERIQ